MNQTQLNDIDAINTEEARKVLRLKAKVVKHFENAALKHLREKFGRDLKAEVANWTSYEVKTDEKKTGIVVVTQYSHDYARPKMVCDTWKINKKELMP